MKDLERTIASLQESLEKELNRKPLGKQLRKRLKSLLEQWDRLDGEKNRLPAGYTLLEAIKEAYIALHDEVGLEGFLPRLRYHEGARFLSEAQWNYLLGEALVRAQHFDAAYPYLVDAYQLDPSVFTSRPLLQRFEKAYEEQTNPPVHEGLREQADQDYQRALAAHEAGDDASALSILTGIPEKARTYEAWLLLAIVADNEALFNDAWTVKEREVLFSTAFEALMRILDTGRERTDWNMRVGYHFMAQDGYCEALSYFEKAYTLEPDNEFFFRQMHECLECCGRDELIEYLQSVNDDRIEESTELFDELDLKAFWDPKGPFAKEYTGGSFTADDVHEIEKKLGCHLPNSYLALMMTQNGGVPLHRAVPYEPDDEDYPEFLEIQGFYPLQSLVEAQPQARSWYPQNGLRFASAAQNAEDGFFFDFDTLDKFGEPAIVYASLALKESLPIADNLDEFIGGLVPRATYDVKTELTALIDRAENAPLTPELFKLVQAAKDGALINMALRKKLARIPRRTRELALDGSADSDEFLDLILWAYTRTHPVMKLEDFVNSLPALINRERFMGVASFALDKAQAWADKRLAAGMVEVGANGYHQLSRSFSEAIKARIDVFAKSVPTGFYQRLETWHHMGFFRLIVESIRMLNTEDRDDDLMGFAAGAYINLDEPDKALMILEQLQERHVSDPAWHYRYGLALLRLELQTDELLNVERLQEAHKAVTMALSLNVREPMKSSAKGVLQDIETMLRMANRVYDAIDEAAEARLVNLQKESDSKPLKRYSDEEREAVLAHLRATYGEQLFVWEEKKGLGFQCDLVCIPPTAERPYYVISTLGLGAWEQAIPPEVSVDVKYCELMLALPEDWPITSSSPEHNAPLSFLGAIAHRPLFYPNEWVAYGVSIDFGNLLASSSPFNGVVFATPQGLDSEEATIKAARLTLPTGKNVNFYQMIPLYRDELQYKESWGFHALMDTLLSKVSFLYDPNRPNSALEITAKMVGKA